VLVQRLLDHLEELDRQVGEMEVPIQVPLDSKSSTPVWRAMHYG
jgi:hypothetical protein